MEGEYVERRPPPALRPFVRRLQGYREYSSAPLRRRQAPVGSCTLILGFGPELRLVGPAGPSAPRSFLAGLHTAAVLTEFTGHQHGMQVDLTPIGAFVLLRRPGSDLADLVPTLDRLDPALAALPHRLADLPDWPTRFAALEGFLAERLLAEDRRLPDPEVAHAWNLLRRNAGGIAVSALAAETGWSRRHLLTRFRSQIGVAPKTAARVLRFERAARLVVGGEAPGTVAALCGYSDQAHLTREFRDLAGLPPRAFVQDMTAGSS
ncbi:helix-turn-helix domain-containing protein [Pseudonocardia oroxyli]|uniref:Transcriptional regulator, AraC family n=1 Tax=Pseudonocardia oroxyli TaxID=366584 RepID=A0A1G7IL41_PSEOR|nr:AraC family transcriptional regulator [Pseudonocardia oroxyli]SDF13363.1 transcriptional regulator, AraC family [Pseudonocardia oroxyli]